MSWQADLRAAAEADMARRREVVPWWVVFDRPAQALFCGPGELPCAARVMYYNAIPVDVRPTTDEEVRQVTVSPARERLAVEERDMRTLMAAVRRSGLHGRYRKAGTGEEYRF